MQIDRHLRRLHRYSTSSAPPKDSAALFILGYFLIYCLFYGLTPNIIGALTFGWYLSLIIEVPARQLYKFRFLSYRMAVAISAFVTFSLLIFGVSRIVPIVLEEGKRLFPVLRESVQTFKVPVFLADSRIGIEITKAIQGATGKLVERTAQVGVDIVNALFQRLPDFTTGLVVFIITAGYFTYVVPVFKQNMWRFFPRSGSDKAIKFVAEVYGDIRHFIAGQIIIALVVGVIVGTGLAIVGVPYSIFLGFISGITNFIPYLGVIVAAVPALVLGLGHGGLIGVIKVLIVLVAANQIEGWFLSPRIQGSRMKLNWFVIILSILVSGAIFGLVGILIAIPLVVFFKKYWVRYVQVYFSKS
jgi:predicted PurR-regulated permease PerM